MRTICAKKWVLIFSIATNLACSSSNNTSLDASGNNTDLLSDISTEGWIDTSTDTLPTDIPLETQQTDTFQVDAGIPTTVWAKSAGGVGTDEGTNIAIDTSGNIYVTGFFSDGAIFDNRTLSSAGQNGIFVAKYNKDGNLAWVKAALGSVFINSYDMALDSSNNVYITGEFYSQIAFENVSLSSSGKREVFVAKYDTNGNIVWAKYAGGSETDMGRSIAIDTSGNAYVTGSFVGEATFGSNTIISSDKKTGDIFIAKYDPSTGAALWVISAGGPESDIGETIKVDPSGNIYVIGNFTLQATFGSHTVSSLGSYDVFVAKYDSSKTPLWVKSGGGSDTEYGHGVAIDTSGNVFVTGHYKQQATFGSKTLTSAGITGELFLAKYYSNGNLDWVKAATGTGAIFGYDLVVDQTGNLFITGQFDWQANFGGQTLSSTGSRDVFVVKYDNNGKGVWAKSAGGAFDEYGMGLSIDQSGNVYVTGAFNDIAVFGTETLSAQGTSINKDIFIWKMSIP